MKILLALLISVSAFATTEKTEFRTFKLTKTVTPGFTLPEYRNTVECNVSDFGMVKFTRYGLTGLVKKEVTYVGIKKNARLPRMIQTAMDGVINQQAGPVDGPSTKYTASVKINNELVDVLLYESNGGVGRVLTNDAPTAKQLITQIDMLCGTK